MMELTELWEAWRTVEGAFLAIPPHWKGLMMIATAIILALAFMGVMDLQERRYRRKLQEMQSRLGLPGTEDSQQRPDPSAPLPSPQAMSRRSRFPQRRRFPRP